MFIKSPFLAVQFISFINMEYFKSLHHAVDTILLQVAASCIPLSLVR